MLFHFPNISMVSLRFIIVMLLLGDLCEQIQGKTRECAVDERGRDYMGTRNITRSGYTCQRWDSQHPNAHNITKYQLPDFTLEDAENHCRNPDTEDELDPWCYTTDPSVEWEYCDVPRCTGFPECKMTAKGTAYRGMKTITKSGKICVRWVNSTEPDLADSFGPRDVNYCRNPDEKEGGPWCYIDDVKNWEFCDIPFCNQTSKCKEDITGLEYNGTLSMTKHGHFCQRWSMQSPHKHNHSVSELFPDLSIEDAENYCRNPDNSSGGPWCYTTNLEVRKDSCLLPLCSDCPDAKCIQDQKVKHVVHIGIDGLKPNCIENATGGAANIMDRIGKSGIYTLTNARTVYVTDSGPGWTSTLCGMGIEVSGVKGNAWRPPWRGHKGDITPATGGHVPFPCVYATIKAQDPEIMTSAYYSWEWLQNLHAAAIPGSLDNQYFCPYIDTDCDQFVVDKSVEYLKQLFKSAKASYNFIYFLSVDNSGHETGWCSKEYEKTVHYVDDLIGHLLDDIEKENMTDEVLFILSADHGGEDKGHGKAADDLLNIPMFIKGPKTMIKQGENFQTLVRNTDIAPTVLYSLNLKGNPWWNGQIMKEAFVEEIVDKTV